MVPGPPPLTEKEYWRDYHIIRDDVNAAMVSCYTHRTLNRIAARDREIVDKLNRTPTFWRITSFSLQSTLFIVLARILDHDDKVHSVHQLLNATIAHPNFFNKEALRARKLNIPGTEPNPPWLDEYVQNAWEPTTPDLRLLKKALAPRKAKFDDIYRPIRHQIAHIIFKDELAISALYSRALKTDIDEILCFLYNLLGAIWEMAFNARPPDLNGDKHGYAQRLAEINKDTEALLRSLT
jgi:hypothetical protein